MKGIVRKKPVNLLFQSTVIDLCKFSKYRLTF